MKKNEIIVLEFCVSKMVYVLRNVDLCQFVLNNELGKQCNFFCQNVILQQIFEGKFIDRFRNLYILGNGFFFYCIYFYCSFLGDLFMVLNEWIFIFIFFIVSIVCYYFVIVVLECMGNVFYLLLIMQIFWVYKMEVFVCGSLVILWKLYYIVYLDCIKE